MPNRILVTYASRGGSTVDIAQAVARTLSDNGLQVDVLPMQDVKDLTPYDTVVAGSAIQHSKWLPEAMTFLQTYQRELAQKRVATFLVCITLAMPNAEKYRAGVMEWLAPVRKLVQPVSEGAFAGMLNFDKLPVTMGTLFMRLMTMIRVFPKDDRRDWQAVERWAGQLVGKL